MGKQWISSKEHLPEESCEVIVKVKNVDRVTLAFFDKRHQAFVTTDRQCEFWVDEGTGGVTAYSKGEVTHWMALPDFPQSTATVFKVKPLQWEEENDGFVAFGSFGTFEVFESGEELPWTGSLNDTNSYDGYESKDCSTVDKAKTHCQTLHEKMIWEALEFVEVQV